jgi:hypothetical protein
MDVTEQAEERRAEAEVLPDAAAMLQAQPEAPETLTVHLPPPPPSAPPPPLNRTWLRIAYVVEFWIVLIAVFIVWSQVGGQAHLDLMAWYIKLICAVALACCAVGMTSAIAERPRAWNAGAMVWLLAMLVLVTLMSYITFWYHLHEQDDQQTDENSATTVSNRIVEHGFLRVVMKRDGENC